MTDSINTIASIDRGNEIIGHFSTDSGERVCGHTKLITTPISISRKMNPTTTAKNKSAPSIPYKVTAGRKSVPAVPTD